MDNLSANKQIIDKIVASCAPAAVYLRRYASCANSEGLDAYIVVCRPGGDKWDLIALQDELGRIAGGDLYMVRTTESEMATGGAQGDMVTTCEKVY